MNFNSRQQQQHFCSQNFSSQFVHDRKLEISMEHIHRIQSFTWNLFLSLSHFLFASCNMPQVVKCASINKFDCKISSHPDVFTPNEWEVQSVDKLFSISIARLFLHTTFQLMCVCVNVFVSRALVLTSNRTMLHINNDSAMNNRMLLKAFKTISKVVLFHTKYLWCSCVSSSFVTVLVFAAACSMLSKQQPNEWMCAESTENCEKRATEQEWSKAGVGGVRESMSCMMKLKRSLFYPLPNISGVWWHERCGKIAYTELKRGNAL